MNFKDRWQLVIDLHRHVESIIDSMRDDADTDANDWCKLYRLQEKLWALESLLHVENTFGYALYVEMENMKISDEDSKWIFPIERAFNNFIKDCFVPAIDSLIDCSMSWKFEDYRARNFQNELRQKMEMLRDAYREQYDL